MYAHLPEQSGRIGSVNEVNCQLLSGTDFMGDVYEYTSYEPLSWKFTKWMSVHRKRMRRREEICLVLNENDCNSSRQEYSDDDMESYCDKMDEDTDGVGKELMEAEIRQQPSAVRSEVVKTSVGT